MQISIEKILSNLGIANLNEMQLAAVKTVSENNNTILLADTGSGKTLGFLLPFLDHVDTDKTGTQAMIIVPSRELALQIEQVFRKLGSGLKVTTCYGGHKREIEENNLVEAPALIIGTPGRIADHLRRNNIKPDTIEMLVLDEFDKSLELGFMEEMTFIINALKNLKKRILTSATYAVDIPSFHGFDQLVTIDFLSGNIKPALDLKLVESADKDKLDTLVKLLCYTGNRPSIIFCNHREAVERTSALLADNRIVNVYYHGAMEQREREVALCKFRNGSANFLVTTDLAARGLDIPHIRYIIHYHLPATEDVFTHRNGRTARMEASGTAILLLGPDEKLPAYITEDISKINLEGDYPLPDKPKWITLFFGAGKKDKVNKGDIAGFLMHQGGLKKEDLGLIDVKDFFSFAAIRKSKAADVVHRIAGQKIKNKKVNIEVAR